MIAFWDASAIVPLIVREEGSARAHEIWSTGTRLFIWWGTPVEVAHALGRRAREDSASPEDLALARTRAETLLSAAQIVSPTPALRRRAEAIALAGTLRAADALQLAAALETRDLAGLDAFVTFDARLADAARAEGLAPSTQTP